MYTTASLRFRLRTAWREFSARLFLLNPRWGGEVSRRRPNLKARTTAGEPEV